jgi:hypothetical protein
MARDRPNWRAPRKQPHAGNPEDIRHALAKRTSFGDFTPGSGRRQCVSVAKGTGERCRKDCVAGRERCHMHGGTRLMQGRVKPGDVVVRRSGARMHYASVGALEEAYSEGLPRVVGSVSVDDLSAGSRGKIIEAWRNRALDPGNWRLVQEKAPTWPRRTLSKT